MTDEWAPEDFDYEERPRRRGIGVRLVAALVLVGLVAGIGLGVLRLLFS